MGIGHTLRSLLRKTGYDIAKFSPSSHPVARMQQLLRAAEINLILDVGANAGQYAQHVRNNLEYKGQILSFEPLSSVFPLLQANAKNDPSWEAVQIALGETDSTAEINIASNSYSSSLLNMLPKHTQAAPQSRYKGKESIEVRQLDSVFEELCQTNGNIFMKLDTQGYEGQVLRGAHQSLNNISLVQLEMSLVPLYEGEEGFEQLYRMMQDYGYQLVAILPGFSDPVSHHMLQVDGIFERRSETHSA